MNKNLQTQHTMLIQIILVFLIGFSLRLPGIWIQGALPYVDEASIIYEAYAVATTGKDMHGNSMWQALYPAYGDYKAPLFILFSALATKVLGPGLETIRLVSILVGSLTIVVTYAIAYQLSKNSSYAFFSGLSLALLPWHIHFSRLGFEALLGVLFAATTLYFILLARSKPIFLLLSSVSFALATYSYVSLRFVIPLWSLVILGLYFKQYVPLWKYVLISVLLAGIMLIPLITSPHYQVSNQYRLSTKSILNQADYIHHANLLRQEVDNSLIGRLLYHRTLFLGIELAKNMSLHFDPGYLFISGDTNLRHSSGIVGLLHLFYLPILVYAFVYVGKQHLSLGITLCLLFVIALVPASVPCEVPHALRSLNGVLPLSLLLGWGGYYVYIRARTDTSYFKKEQLLVVGIVLLLVFELFQLQYYYHVSYIKHTLTYWYPKENAFTQLVIDLKQSNPNSEIYLVGSEIYDTFYLSKALPHPQVLSDYKELAWEGYPYSLHYHQLADISFYSRDLITSVAPGPLSPRFVLSEEMIEGFENYAFTIHQKYGKEIYVYQL